MKSSVVERSRVSVEDAFWKGLQEIIVKRRDEPVSDRQFANLSSAIRLFALGFYRERHLLLLRTLLRPPRPSHAITHHPSLTYCRFHSSPLIGSSDMPYTALTCTLSVNKPRCLPSDTSAACLSCIFTHSAPWPAGSPRRSHRASPCRGLRSARSSPAA